MVNEEDLRSTVALPNDPLRIAQGGGRSASHRRRLAQAGDDPALEIFSGRRSRAIGVLPERATDREQVVACDHGRALADVRGIHGVGVIADVHEVDGGGELAPQLPGEEEKFIEIPEPFRDESARPE